MSSKGIMQRARRLSFALLLALVIPAVFAQSPPARNRDDLDVTMHVIVDPDAKVPDEIVRRIALPKPAQPANGATSTGTTESGQPAKDEKPAPGANGQGREFGQQVSEEAKQRSEEARHNKKPSPPNKPPGKPPSPPGRPSNPGG